LCEGPAHMAALVADTDQAYPVSKKACLRPTVPTQGRGTTLSLEVRTLLHQNRHALCCSAVDMQSGLKLAIKAFRRPKVFGDTEEWTTDQILRERRVAMELGHHRMVVPCVSSFQTWRAVCLVFEWQPHGDLFELLAQKGALTEPTARFYGACVLEALSHAHATGWCHRDLKPENVLLGSDGYAKLTDWGAACGVHERQRLPTYASTASYMSPEALRGNNDGVSQDWWAFGILLFECLLADSPFDEAGPPESFQSLPLPAPPGLPREEARALLLGLCDPQAERRLGSTAAGGVDTLRAHAWWGGLDFGALVRGALPPPPLPGESGSPVPCRPAGGLALGAPPPPVRRLSQALLPLPPPPLDMPMSPGATAHPLTELEEGPGLACFGPHVELHIPWL